jgi:hypothetical protein
MLYLIRRVPAEFERIDANTWRSLSTGGCGTAVVQPLWRAPGDRWSYRMVKTVPPQREGKEPCNSETIEFVPHYKARRISNHGGRPMAGRHPKVEQNRAM